MSKPLLLDLFCGCGGAAVGYTAAGFDCIGVDIKPQPNYPYEFHQISWEEGLSRFSQIASVIHASPPCQAYSVTKSLHTIKHPAILPVVIDALARSSKIFVVENVPGSRMPTYISLSGKMFGLPLIKKRFFHSNILLLSPSPPSRRHRSYGRNCTAYNFSGTFLIAGHHYGSAKQWQAAMQIPYPCTKQELAQAIPPAYTRFIGLQLINALENTKAVPALSKGNPFKYNQ